MGMLIMLTGNSVRVLLFPNTGNTETNRPAWNASENESVHKVSVCTVHVFTFVQSNLDARVSETGALVKLANCRLRLFLARISV